MATIIEGKGDEYLFTFSRPETEWIRLIANSFSISKEAAIGAAMNKGLCHYVETLRQSDEHDKAERHAEDKDKPDTSG